MDNNTISNILDFGAIGDGESLNTRAIQAAIDTCPKNDVVYIPAGTFRCGAIHLKSDMTLICQKAQK